ncbi:hypothetical protein J7I98_09300 [Streptomyces sp. ISL-98]|uniref:hypothetical protein n=1 Tax=Streptomyces sp. ISL-98 TaxID=2819192 RepID=UPI001BEAFA30|nr:hypothetical protein [Streptomyces sp. ISL-98]MBT2506088.1 hypothetical protein [Streptomyces sp. ISL-98]
METDASLSSHRPTPAEAAAALNRVEHARSSVAQTPIPLRIGVLLVAIVVAVPLTRLLPGVWPSVVCVLLAAAGGAIGAWQVRVLGFRGRMTSRDVALLVALVAVCIAGFATAAFLGSFVWFAVAAANGVLMAARVLLVGRVAGGER